MADRDDAHARTVLAPPSDTFDVAAARVVVADRYEILGLVGGGAMGTVYRARDRELDEVVALKVLKKDLAGAPGMIERFRREVKLARRVTHRNVARTYDIGEDGGDRFLTMELVDGDSLADRLASAGRLSVREVVAIARDICAGLGAAHDAGVLHRDLKPDNVIVARDGRAVITDFGIARAAMEADARTAVGSFIGTPLYMAPEQVEGARDLDGRADLYALGAMLYELLTGSPAWQRDSIVAVAAARLISPPPDPRSVVPELSAAAAGLVQRLMARRREERPPTAADVSRALEALDPQTFPRMPALAARSTECRKRVAVLPLATSAGEDDVYLAYGVTEELTDLLSMIGGLAVRPRVTPAILGDVARQPREAGRLLDVDVVVDGAVRRVGDRVRVTLRVVTVEDGFQLWAQRFERPAAEVLEMSEQAAREIGRVLSTKAPAPEPPAQAQAQAPAPNPRAQELYLRGRYLLNFGFGPNREQAVETLRGAYELAPSDPRIAGAFAMALARLYRAEHAKSAAGIEARAVAFRALELDATRPEGRIALGTIHLADGDGEKAAVELAGALRVARSNVDALDAMGRLLVEAGEADEGIRMLTAALAIENVALARHNIARTQALLGEWELALETMAGLEPGSGGVLPLALMQIRVMSWCTDRAIIDVIARRIDALPLSEDQRRGVARLADVIRGLAPRSEAGPIFDLLLSALPARARRGICFREQLRAEGLMINGDQEGAMAAIGIADSEQLFDILWLDRCPVLEPLRTRRGFADIRARVAARAQAIVAAYDRSRLRIGGGSRSR